MKRSISEIKQRLLAALAKRGVSHEDSEMIADEYLTGEMMGRKTHGLNSFPSLLNVINGPLKSPEITRETHSLIVVEANGIPGAVVGKWAVEKLVKKAETEGVAVGLIKNMITWLRPGTIAKYVSSFDMIGMVMNNGGSPMTAPPGGFDPVIGTNPIAIGIPTSADPIIADMATAKKAWGEVRIAKKEGAALPEETFFDASGNFATNPDDAYSVAAMGDYKGFALGLLIEILTSSFMDRPFGLASVKKDERTMTRGGVIIILNPALTSKIANFKQENSDLVSKIKQSKKLAGVDEIFLPGEKSTGLYNENLKLGELEVSDDLWEQIQ